MKKDKAEAKKANASYFINKELLSRIQKAFQQINKYKTSNPRGKIGNSFWKKKAKQPLTI